MGYNSIDFDMSFPKPAADKCAAMEQEIIDAAVVHYKATKCEVVDGEPGWWNVHIEWKTEDVVFAASYAKQIQDLIGQDIILNPKEMTH